MDDFKLGKNLINDVFQCNVSETMAKPEHIVEVTIETIYFNVTEVETTTEGEHIFKAINVQTATNGDC